MGQTLEALRERNVTLFENVSPSKDHWLNRGTGVSGCSYPLTFLRNEVRVELWLQRSDARENKWLFDRLGRERAEIEKRFGDRLRWLRLDDKKASRVLFASRFDGFNESNWPDVVDWLCEHIVRLEQGFSEPLARLNGQLKSGIDLAVADDPAAEGLAAAD